MLPFSELRRLRQEGDKSEANSSYSARSSLEKNVCWGSRNGDVILDAFTSTIPDPEAESLKS